MAPGLQLSRYIKIYKDIYIWKEMDHVSARNSNEGCFVGRDPLTRCCASATYAAGLYRVGALVRPMNYSKTRGWDRRRRSHNLPRAGAVDGYSRPYSPKPRDQIDVDDLTTFFVTYMKNDTLAGIERGHPVLWGRWMGGTILGLQGSRHGRWITLGHIHQSLGTRSTLALNNVCNACGHHIRICSR